MHLNLFNQAVAHATERGVQISLVFEVIDLRPSNPSSTFWNWSRGHGVVHRPFDPQNTGAAVYRPFREMPICLCGSQCLEIQLAIDRPSSDR